MTSLVIMALESSHIIENSISPDTVIGRCQLLKSIFEDLEKTRSGQYFGIELQEGIDHYKQTYYDRVLTKTQLSIAAVATLDNLNAFFYTHIERSFFAYIDKHLFEVSMLNKKEAKAKRRAKLDRFILDSNVDMLKLFFNYNAANLYVDKVELLVKLLFNYLELKNNGFDEDVVIEINEIEYFSENDAPITDIARQLVKTIKSKLWLIQHDIINQEHKIKLMVNGNNVALALDPEANAGFKEKIKSVFK